MSSIFRRAALAATALSLVLPPLAVAQSMSGAYLAGRQAVFESDFAAAARYFEQVLQYDPDNPRFLENEILSLVALGRFDKALAVAQRMEGLGLDNQMANMVIAASLAAEDRYDDLLGRLGRESGGIGPLVDGLVQGWAMMGSGTVSAAITQFEKVATRNGVRGFALYHKALALASVGDFEGAEAVFSGKNGRQSLFSRRAVVARAEILSQLGRADAALKMLDDALGGADPAVARLAERLKSGERLPFDVISSPREGIAEVFYSVGAALRGDASDEYALLYARLAEYLDAGHVEAMLLAADLLESLGQLDLAEAAFKRVPPDSPEHFAAELGRAEVLRRAGKPDAAVEVLEQLARDYPDQPQVYSSLGDLLRQQENYADAVKAYDKALKLSPEGSDNRWFLYYARGIGYERLDQWEKAEADFRKALELSPDQPQVLNYLGYSMVEKQADLDEALSLIERAVAARPDSGYIVDSLGWALFRLGRYEEAVGHMERAVELMPVDPVVNDHLGDVYWAVGRKREARFQWRRALSFIPEDGGDGEADPERIRRKLEIGLDAVLASEGAPPLVKVANGDR